MFTSCSGWVGGRTRTDSSYLPCALIHRMCSMSLHPSPSHCFLLECTPPFPEWPGFPLVRLGRRTASSQQHLASGNSFSELEQPMVGSIDGREAGRGWVSVVGQGRTLVGWKVGLSTWGCVLSFD